MNRAWTQSYRLTVQIYDTLVSSSVIGGKYYLADTGMGINSYLNLVLLTGQWFQRAGWLGRRKYSSSKYWELHNSLDPNERPNEIDFWVDSFCEEKCLRNRLSLLMSWLQQQPTSKEGRIIHKHCQRNLMSSGFVFREAPLFRSYSRIVWLWNIWFQLLSLRFESKQHTTYLRT